MNMTTSQTAAQTATTAALPCVETKCHKNTLHRPPAVHQHLLQPRHQGHRVPPAHLRRLLPLALRSATTPAAAPAVVSETVAQGQRVQAPLAGRQVPKLCCRQAFLPAGRTVAEPVPGVGPDVRVSSAVGVLRSRRSGGRTPTRSRPPSCSQRSGGSSHNALLAVGVTTQLHLEQ